MDKLMKGTILDIVRTSTGYLIICDTVIPLKLNEEFTPPDLEGALLNYPSWKRHSKSNWDIQAYFCFIIKQLDRIKPNGYDGQKALNELKYYLGENEIEKLFKTTGGAK